MNTLLEYLKGREAKFRPMPWYNEVGNMIEWHWKPDMSYATPIHVDGVWVGDVHRSQDTDEVVGVNVFLDFMKKAGVFPVVEEPPFQIERTDP